MPLSSTSYIPQTTGEKKTNNLSLAGSISPAQLWNPNYAQISFLIQHYMVL